MEINQSFDVLYHGEILHDIAMVSWILLNRQAFLLGDLFFMADCKKLKVINGRRDMRHSLLNRSIVTKKQMGKVHITSLW